MQDRISIIIPSYNRGYIIKKSIDSILNQSYQNFEIIVVDDCSTDNTESIVKSISDKRVRYIRLEKNSGANKARNVGIENSKYNLIAFQDSDDEWHKNKLEKQLKYLKENSFDIVSCKYNQYENNKFIQIIPNFDLDNKNDMLNNILYKNFISTQTILGKKVCFLREKFDESMPRFQDWELAIRLLRNYNVGFQNIPLVDVFLQENSISKDEKKGLKAVEKIYEKHYDIIKKNKKIDSYINRYIYVLTIINENPNKKFVKKAFKLNFTVKNLIFYIISLLNLERFYLKYRINKNKKN